MNTRYVGFENDKAEVMTTYEGGVNNYRGSVYMVVPDELLASLFNCTEKLVSVYI